MGTLPDPYEADPVTELKPTAREIAEFSAHPVKTGIYYYDHNVGKFLASLSDGIDDAVLLAQDEHRECPQALLILAGYSQGVMAIHQAEYPLAADHDTGVLQQIAATLLLADGDQIRKSAVKERYGSAPDTATGIRTWFHGNNSKDVLQPASTASICAAGDIVCDLPLARVEGQKAANAAVAVHQSYARQAKNGKWTYNAALTSAGTWAAGLAVKASAAARARSAANAGTIEHGCDYEGPVFRAR